MFRLTLLNAYNVRTLCSPFWSYQEVFCSSHSPPFSLSFLQVPICIGENGVPYNQCRVKATVPVFPFAVIMMKGYSRLVAVLFPRFFIIYDRKTFGAIIPPFFKNFPHFCRLSFFCRISAQFFVPPCRL